MTPSNTPDFSIITPSYNYADYIEECIESVLQQEGVTWEHIIYDAGSTDGTLDILKKHDHLDLTVEPDKGMSEAINKGFRKARGTWVMWLNTDDKLLPGALKSFKDFAKDHPEADVIYGGCHFVDTQGKVIKNNRPLPFYQKLFAHAGCYVASTACFYRKKTTLAEGFLLNERFKYIMDGEFYNRLGTAGKRFVYFPMILADFRIHGKNLSMDYGDIKDIDKSLTRQYATAESIAIRRSYGWTPFKSFYLNTFSDFLLRLISKPIKCFLRLGSKRPQTP